MLPETQWSNCKIAGRGNAMAIAGARAYNGGLGRSPRWHLEPPGQGVRGAKLPWSLRLFCSWTLDRPVGLVGFSVFHSVQCSSVSESREICHVSQGHGVPLEKRKGNAIPPGSPSIWPLQKLQSLPRICAGDSTCLSLLVFMQLFFKSCTVRASQTGAKTEFNAI